MIQTGVKLTISLDAKEVKSWPKQMSSRNPGLLSCSLLWIQSNPAVTV